MLVPNAHLVGLYLQIFATAVYGVYLPQCVLILHKKVKGGLSLWLPGACLVMLAITALDFILGLYRGYQSWAVPGPDEPPNPTKFWADASSTLSLVKNSTTIGLAIVSDIIMVYRTFLVWNFNLLVIAAPVGLLLGNTALGIWSMWTLAQTKTGSNLILASVSVRLKYFFIVTFCLNVFCAALICGKVWRISSSASPAASGRHRTSRVIEVVVETAALYCAHLFVLIVTDSIGSNVYFVFLDALPPVTALVFTLMIVRARPAQTHSTTLWASSLNLKLWSTSGGVSSHTRGSARRDGTLAVEIDLERIVHRDRDPYAESVPAHEHEDGAARDDDDSERKDAPKVSDQSPA